jgi:hypothetical protein
LAPAGSRPAAPGPSLATSLPKPNLQQEQRRQAGHQLPVLSRRSPSTNGTGVSKMVGLGCNKFLKLKLNLD